MVIIQQRTNPPKNGKMGSKFLIVIFACVMGLYALNANALTTLKASVDRNPAMVGETFNLIVVADASLSRNALNTKSLLKQFVVGQTSTSSNTQIINGAMTRQTTWRIPLMSRKAGDLVIPALTADNLSTAPVNIKIIEQTATANDTQDVKLETSVSATSVYIGQPIIYEIKLLIGARLQRAQLQPPVLSGSEISQIGEDQDSSEIVGGKRYRTITRRYNISPSQAGKFELEGSLFKGDISQYGYGRSKPVTLLGESHSVVVKPIPTDFPGEWLVSDMVVIQDQWAQEQKYRVGEPITRTVTLSAANVSTAQMPELLIDGGSSLQSYPDKPIAQQGLNGITLIAQTIQKIALIPIVSGDITVPEVKIPWFNATTEKVDWATVPAKTISVNPAIVPALPNNDLEHQLPKKVEKPQAIVIPPSLQKSIEAHQRWKNISIGLTIALMSSWGFMLFNRHRPSPPSSAVRKTFKSSSEYYDTLLSSLKNNDLANVTRLIPLWLKDDFNVTIDSNVAQKHDITMQYNQLTQSQFGRSVTSFECSALLAGVLALAKEQKTKSETALNGLYKK